MLANRTNVALSTNELIKQAPSIFTGNRSENTSEKYTHISTASILDHLEIEGFLCMSATQTRCRTRERSFFTKHMLRFRHVNSVPTVDGLFPEIILINSHDGLNSYRLMSGLFRLVCSNGLVAGSTYEEIRIRHQGNILDQVASGTHQIMSNSLKMLGRAEQMLSLRLNPLAQLQFAESAHAIRFENSDLGKAIEPISLLKQRRFGESHRIDLFSIFNLVQENLIKGGLRGAYQDENNRVKRVTTRPIKGIDQNCYLNQALWELAEKTYLSLN